MSCAKSSARTCGAGRPGWSGPERTCIRSSRSGACCPKRCPARTSPTWGCRSSAWPPGSRRPARTGSAAARWCPRSLPRARCPGCCRQLRSTAPTTSTAAWWIPSRSGGPSRWAPATSTCCRWAGSRARWRSLPVRGRWGWWRSRSPAGTGSTRRCCRCPPASAFTSCPPAGTGRRPDCHSSVTVTGLRWGRASNARMRRP
jgi:hypothetical protein